LGIEGKGRIKKRGGAPLEWPNAGRVRSIWLGEGGPILCIEVITKENYDIKNIESWDHSQR